MTEKIRNQKDSLARLMATENLTVVHKKIPTAYFDVALSYLWCALNTDWHVFHVALMLAVR